MPTENRSANAPFQREDRYIVIKLSDLANVRASVAKPFAEQLTAIQRRFPKRECLVIESDWPEFEPAWAAIEARVTGEPVKKQAGSGQFNDDDRYLLCREELRECEEERSELSQDAASLRAQLAERDALLRDLLRCNVGFEMRQRLEKALSASAEPSAPVGHDELPAFAQKIIRKLQRVQECFEDSQGTDIGKEWLDLLCKLGLMNRVQRSPALWEISDEGDAVLEARAALECEPDEKS